MWFVNFNISPMTTYFPFPLCVSQDSALSPAYRSEGRLRQNETHCLFHYTLEGEGEVWTRDGKWKLSENHGFLSIINDASSGYNYPLEGKKPWHFLFFCFEGGNMREVTRHLIETHGPVFKLSSDAGIIKQLISFQSNDRLNFFMNPIDGMNLVTQLIASLWEAANTAPAKSLEDPLVLNARSVVDRYLLDNINATEVAQHLCVSREHLSRVFHSCTGATLQKYILRKKLLLACRMLKTTHMTIKDISEQMNFDSPSNFVRIFRREMGVTPSEFRKSGIMPTFR